MHTSRGTGVIVGYTNVIATCKGEYAMCGELCGHSDLRRYCRNGVDVDRLGEGQRDYVGETDVTRWVYLGDVGLFAAYFQRDAVDGDLCQIIDAGVAASVVVEIKG